MSEWKVSPLLDAMEVGECFASRGGVSCYRVRHPESGREFVLKKISVPARSEQVKALLLTGACENEAQAGEYFAREAKALVEQAECTKQFAECPNLLPFLGAQAQPKEQGVGSDVYAVLPWAQSLKAYMDQNAVSHLKGINLGIDLCAALQALREAGYLHANIKPENIFLTESGRFLLGDFGLLPTRDLQYAVLPEQYKGPYAAPELYAILGGLNPTIDLYAVGMLLYRIYNGGHAPFEDEQTGAKTAEDRRLEGQELPAPLYADYELAQIIQKACAFDPKDRYQTPDELRQELEQYMKRNAVSDNLIVPPIITDEAPLAPEQAAEEAEPVRFADVEQMDETFKQSFAPDTAGAGDSEQKPARKEKKRRKKQKSKQTEEAPAEAPTAEPEQAPAEAPTAEPEQAPEAEPSAPETEPSPAPEADTPAPDAGQADAPAEAPAPAEPAEREAQTSPAPSEPEPEPEPEEEEIKPLNIRRRDPAKERRKRILKRRLWIAFSICTVLLLTLIALYEFTDLSHGLYHYFVKVESLETFDVTADALSLRLSANMDEDDFTVLCQDAYGNNFQSPVEGGEAHFTGLNPGTQYSIRLALPGAHKLSGVTSTTVTTMPETEILTFTATTGSQEGAALLNLVVKDGSAEPAEWTLRYGADGDPEKTHTFSGHSTQITGLLVGTEYTFRLVGSDTLYLTGETLTTFIPAREVLADNLSLDSLEDGVAHLSWRCNSQLPQQWNVSVTDADNQPLEVTLEDAEGSDDGYLCRASVSGVVPGTAYLVKITADGLFQGLTMEIPDTLIYLSDFTAQAGEGSIALSWAANREPEGGWLITSSIGQGETLELADTAQGSSFTLRPAVPGATYRLSIKAADGSRVTGHDSAQLQLPEAERFNRLGLTGEGTTIGMYETPDKEEWSYDDLTGGTVELTAESKITVLITAGGVPEQSDESMDILFVTRSSEGEILHVSRTSQTWNEMWTGGRWGAQLPYIPSQSGSYSLTVYVGGLRMGTINYQVS